MVYTLTLEQIKNILKEGKFDENKHAEDLTLYSVTAGEITSAYDDCLEKILKKTAYEDLCKEIYEELTDTLSDYADEIVFNEFYDDYYNIVSDYVDEEN